MELSLHCGYALTVRRDMRLLRLDERGEPCLAEGLPDELPPYAILSHTWGNDDDEVTFDDLRDGKGNEKAGYAKLKFCGQQAQKDNLEYFWVDTCCINKPNLTELSEAINSMYRWYAQAKKCYVYLSDVSARKRDHYGETEQLQESAFRASRWFTRGWTLQELLAPSTVEFFSREGQHLGDKKTRDSVIENITGIPRDALHGTALSKYSVDERMAWAAQRKTKKTEDKVYCLLGIFEVSMSLIYGEGEEALVRLRDKIARRYQIQLEGIGQGFFNPNSQRLQAHAHTSSSQGISLVDRRKDILTALSFDQMDSRRSTIKIAYSTTCKWLLQHESYVQWTDPERYPEHHGFLWINGKPGAGKSTLVKFAHAYAEKHKAEDEIVVSFFFNARGNGLEKSTSGMYRSILHQMLSKAPHLEQVFDNFCQNLESPWTTESLRTAFSLAVASLGHRRLKCFIDALDECDEDEIQDMVAFFEEIGEDAALDENQLHVCFASRHYPTIDIRNGLKLILEREDGHGEDLAKYVHSHLRGGKGKDVQEVRDLIHEKSNGVFMWAVLVVDILNKEYRRGRGFAVKRRLEEIPPKLSDLFKDILLRDSENMDDLLLCLQWILFAKQPLRREEFYSAMVAGLDPGVNSENLRQWEYEIPSDRMDLFVLSSSKGLAELTKSKAPTVQFIHESVKDFLVKDGGMRELWPDLGEDLSSFGHDKLKICCQNYLHGPLDLHIGLILGESLPKAHSDATKDVRQRLTSLYPFLEYASRYIFYHANEAAAKIEQGDFLEDFRLDRWIKFVNAFKPHDNHRYTPNADLTYILAESGCERLIKVLSEKEPVAHLRSLQERYECPLLAAFANGHREVIRVMLEESGNASAVDAVTRDQRFGKWFDLRRYQSPLHWAIDEGQVALAQALISPTHYESPWVQEELQQAAVRNDVVVDLLFELTTGKPYVNLSSPNRKGQRRQDEFLSVVKNRKWTRGIAIAKLLLDNGVDIESRDGDGCTALILATIADSTTPSMRGTSPSPFEMVEMLLQYGANCEAVDKDNATALIHAARFASPETGKLLLANGANIEAINNQQQTPLLAAAFHGNTNMARVLVEKGANVEAVDRNNRTALLLAARNLDLVSLLIAHGADVGKAEIGGAVPLHWATYYGAMAPMEALLAQGADIEHRDVDGKTALNFLMHPLATAMKIPSALLLLEKGADIEARDNAGRTPLLCSIRSDLGMSTYQCLLDQGADMGAVDYEGNTALMMALQILGIFRINDSSRNAMRFLLQKGASVDVKRRDGETALSIAATAGDCAAVQILLDFGATIDESIRQKVSRRVGYSEDLSTLLLDEIRARNIRGHQ